MPLMTWATHVLQWQSYRGKQSSDVEQIPKSCPSSDCRLQLAYMKSELLVIADQHAAVNTFPGLVHTARHTMGVGSARSRYPNLKRREPSKVRPMTGVKS